MPEKKRYCFPLEFQKALVARQMDYARTARAMNKRGYPVSKQYIGMLGGGQRNAPPEQVRRICEVLGLADDERKQLHKAAAIDVGYELGPL